MWEKQDRVVVENSRNLFEKHSWKLSFWYKSCPKTCGENPCEMGETGSKTSPKTCLILAKTAPFYRATKTSSGANPQVRWPVGRPANDHIYDRWGCRSTDRSTSPRSWPVGWPVGRLRLEPESIALWPVDRGKILRVNSLDQSTGFQARACARLCAHWSTSRSTDFWSGRSVGRPPEAQVRVN